MRGLLLLLLLLPALSAGAQEELHPMYRHSGLPVPRFVSLKSDEINTRSGPGKDYPVSWVYTRADYPVKVVEEFGLWRKIEDHQGDGGWVYHSLLSGKRTAYVTGKEGASLYASAGEGSRVIARLAPQVIADVEECSLTRCLLNAAGLKGWADRSLLWGTQVN
jgi:SH3-like domain-containing protein